MVIRRLEPGRSPLPYRVTDVANGMADPLWQGMAFQITIDFVPTDDQIQREEMERLSAKLDAMRDEGLSDQADPQDAVSSGWQIGPRTGRGTRSLISRWLRDTKRDWEGLREVLSLMRDREFSRDRWGRRACGWTFLAG
ncbi:hypothetical protein [Streptomyces sp. NPDC005573]|uniref:hypothetical protein n=1 Tax=Streptomyces sp. NPDC005573 TaxID=3156890 RepID=UPI0033A07D70